ncbi:aldehyde dehydrogenase family protein, partial [Chloroflexota bacterium]
MTIRAVNPTTDVTIKEYEEMTPQEVGSTIEATHQAFIAWRKASFADRAAPMRRAARILRDKAEEYAVLMAQEMGKPVSNGSGEAAKCAWVCDYYAESAEGLLQPEV